MSRILMPFQKLLSKTIPMKSVGCFESRQTTYHLDDAPSGLEGFPVDASCQGPWL
ncbi:hypothetical protein LIA77_09007 [Sarocladium implicatum]|nr:hypothetical protein LIA77_09007 [Sarocladium implicatum]